MYTFACLYLRVLGLIPLVAGWSYLFMSVSVCLSSSVVHSLPFSICCVTLCLIAFILMSVLASLSLVVYYCLSVYYYLSVYCCLPLSLFASLAAYLCCLLLLVCLLLPLSFSLCLSTTALYLYSYLHSSFTFMIFYYTIIH
ncbi:hypothetical protein EDC96DRAFT_497735 [Choanephora cucurbitarum]|nr:hypothetical protein EDC96DRAFT_497695 [Choanephora cucurbitarum]KAI8375061.1 hypothetical protein EDC96DRAFT_497735 [Choanephora cucurbitarum]